MLQEVCVSMANIIIKSDERREQEREVLRDYGVNPDKASASERELAEAINYGTNMAYEEMRRYN